VYSASPSIFAVAGFAVPQITFYFFSLICPILIIKLIILSKHGTTDKSAACGERQMKALTLEEKLM
jgi:hypothetical protein